MLFGWISSVSLRLKIDTARISACTDCKGCDRACFMDVTPRKNKRDISCVNCGACIEACNRELGEGKGLFHLGFGKGSVLPIKENHIIYPTKETIKTWYCDTYLPEIHLLTPDHAINTKLLSRIIKVSRYSALDPDDPHYTLLKNILSMRTMPQLLQYHFLYVLNRRETDTTSFPVIY
jgi:ferredoxin